MSAYVWTLLAEQQMGLVWCEETGEDACRGKADNRTGFYAE
jgi:hypothetical protein